MYELFTGTPVTMPWISETSTLLQVSLLICDFESCQYNHSIEGILWR